MKCYCEITHELHENGTPKNKLYAFIGKNPLKNFGSDAQLVGFETSKCFFERVNELADHHPFPEGVDKEFSSFTVLRTEMEHFFYLNEFL
jgi:hypothetical protein